MVLVPRQLYRFMVPRSPRVLLVAAKLIDELSSDGFFANLFYQTVVRQAGRRFLVSDTFPSSFFRTDLLL